MVHRGPWAVPIELGEQDRAVLEGWAGGEGRRAVRARIVLACAVPGSVNAHVASELGISKLTVSDWRRRFAQLGLAGLEDRGRAGLQGRPGADRHRAGATGPVGAAAEVLPGAGAAREDRAGLRGRRG